MKNFGEMEAGLPVGIQYSPANGKTQILLFSHPAKNFLRFEITSFIHYTLYSAFNLSESFAVLDCLRIIFIPFGSSWEQ